MITEATCRRCGETKPAAAFNKKKRSPNGLQFYCRLCVAEYGKEWHARPGNLERRSAHRMARRATARVEALGHYGGVCACCGEADVRFLTFDHVDGGGTEHRRSNSAMNHSPGEWLRRNGYPEGFQVLCWNCNSGRETNGGICPHQDPGGRITCADWQHGD